MSLLWKLHNKTKARVHSMVCIRGPKGNDFKLIFSPQLEMPHTIKEGVDTMNKELEKCIMLAPEQYAWEYKKYRRAANEDHYK
jgi:KDO2-lipid IV(A) lauroyltransferase